MGTGKNINVWYDDWLSSTEQLRPYGPAPKALKDLKVSDLMLANSTDWDHQKIDTILPFHKQVILQIKPSICNAPDEMVWLKSASGVYTAKSGYKAQGETTITEEAPVPETNIDWLANVWKLKTSEKVKVFLWNSLHDALPVGKQSAIRNIPLTSRCPRCNEVESVAHVLFTCSYAKKVWTLASLALRFDPSPVITTRNGQETLRLIPPLHPTGVGPGTLSASICWDLWIFRNHLVFQKRDFTPEETLLKATREAREWTISQDQLPKPQSHANRIAQDPTLDPNRTCMYTDAAWNLESRCAGLAGPSSSHSAPDTSLTSPLMAETLALRSALNSALHRGINTLLIRSDSQDLINLVNAKGRHLEIASLLNDIYLISSLFAGVKFKFIPRLDNSRADYVAKQALLMYQT